MLTLISLGLLLLQSTLSIAQLLPLRNGRANLPVLQDPLFNSRPAEVIIQSQFKAWGLNIDLDLDVDVDAQVNLLGLDLLAQKDGEKRSLGKGDTAELNLGLNLGTGVSDKLLDLNTGIGALEAGVAVHPGDWGKAEQAAKASKGPRGFSAWYTYISIGEPPQSIPVIPDTGSADLFVFDSTCSTCRLQNHSSFDSHASHSYTNISQNWSTEYNDGTAATGYIGKDTITIGTSGHLSTPLAFAIATTLAEGNDDASSGIMGLSMNDLSDMPAEEIGQGATLFSRLVKNKQLADNILGIRIDKPQASQGVVHKAGGGMYTFGGVEERHIIGGQAGLIWIPTTGSLYWGFGLDDITLGGASVIGVHDNTERRAMVDTGTTTIMTSPQIATAIHSRIAGSKRVKSGVFYIPCNVTYPATQNLFINISGQKCGIPIGDLAWKKTDKYEGMCVSGVQGGEQPFTILGDMFIKNHYVALAFGDSQLGNPKVGIGRRPSMPVVL